MCTFSDVVVEHTYSILSINIIRKSRQRHFPVHPQAELSLPIPILVPSLVLDKDVDLYM